MEQTAAITVTTSATLAPALAGLKAQLIAAARAAVDEATTGEAFTELERRAMAAVEALKLSHGIDLAAMMARWEILNEIQRDGLVAYHPGGYATLDEAARDNGISTTEMKNTITVCGTIFPWLEQHGYSIAQLWADVGKSGFFEMAPILQCIITGQRSERGSVNAAVENALQNAHASIVAEEGADYEPSNEEVATGAINNLIHLGQTTPVARLRRALRPDGTPDVPGVILATTEEAGDVIVILRANPDQMRMLINIAGSHMNVTRVTAREDDQIGLYEDVNRLIG